MVGSLKWWMGASLPVLRKLYGSTLKWAAKENYVVGGGGERLRPRPLVRPLAPKTDAPEVPNGIRLL